MSFAARLRARGASPAAAAMAAPPAAAEPLAAPIGYVGLVTRAVAFAIDVALVDLVALLTAAVVALAVSVISISDDVRTALIAVGGVTYALWVVGYFVVFWSTTGQTPGSRLLRFRVVAVDGRRLRPRRALLRFVALTLAALPLFAGCLLILVDARRRGLHDLVARTLVVDVLDGDRG